MEKYKRILITVPPKIAKELRQIKDSEGIPISRTLVKSFSESKFRKKVL